MISSNLSRENSVILSDLLISYYQLKNALVASDSGLASIKALGLDSQARVFSNNLESNNMSKEIIGTNLDSISFYSQILIKARDIEGKRIPFEKISDQLYLFLKKAEVKNAGVYHSFCPMAFNDKGAYWLSEKAEIKNPYFGKRMLECGEVTDSL